MNVKLSSSLLTLTQNKNPGPRKLSLRVMQNIYSPNRFYLTFPHGNFRSFDKILNIIKKPIFTILYKCMIFPLCFGWSLFVLIMWNLFLSTFNECTIIIVIIIIIKIIMIIIIINVKRFLEIHFLWDFN